MPAFISHNGEYLRTFWDHRTVPQPSTGSSFPCSSASSAHLVLFACSHLRIFCHHHTLSLHALARSRARNAPDPLTPPFSFSSGRSYVPHTLTSNDEASDWHFVESRVSPGLTQRLQWLRPIRVQHFMPPHFPCLISLTTIARSDAHGGAVQKRFSQPKMPAVLKAVLRGAEREGPSSGLSCTAVYSSFLLCSYMCSHVNTAQIYCDPNRGSIGTLNL